MAKGQQRLVKRLITTILSFDRFGSSINLSIKNQTTHKTLIGAIISIGIVILVIFSFVSLLYDMLYTQDATVVADQQYDPNPKVSFLYNGQVFELLSNEYLLGITVTNNLGSPIQQNTTAMIYQTQARHCYREFNNLTGFQSNCTIFNLVPCTLAKIDPNLLTVNDYAIYKDLQINPFVIQAFYCINTTEWANSTLAYQGTAISTELQTMNLRITPCVNGSVKNQVCASPQVINASLNNAFAGVIIPNYLLNQKSGQKPYTSSFKVITTALTNTLLTYMEIYLQPSNTTTLQNYFHYFGTQNVHSKLLYNRQDQSFQSIPSEGQIGSFTFLLDDQRVDYYFSYYDIFFVLGNIGGLANVLVLMGNILILPLSKLSLDLFMINQIYTFEKTKERKTISKSREQKELQGKLKKNNSIVFLQQYKASRPVSQNFLTDINTNVAWLKQIFKQKIVKARFTLGEYIFQCYPGPKALLIQDGVDKIYQKLDSLYIIKKLIEIDKLKALLLNDQQIKLFEQLPKPSLSKEQNQSHAIVRDTPNTSFIQSQNLDKPPQSEFDIFHKQKPFLEELSDVFEAYQKISENPNELDKKLLSLLDKDVLHIFSQVAHNLRSQKILGIEPSSRGLKDCSENYIEDQLIEESDQRKNIVRSCESKQMLN